MGSLSHLPLPGNSSQPPTNVNQSTANCMHTGRMKCRPYICYANNFGVKGRGLPPCSSHGPHSPEEAGSGPGSSKDMAPEPEWGRLCRDKTMGKGSAFPRNRILGNPLGPSEMHLGCSTLLRLLPSGPRCASKLRQCQL